MIRLKPEAMGCTLCGGEVVLDGNHYRCMECGHRMSRADFPPSDRALHAACDQAEAFAEEGQDQ